VRAYSDGGLQAGSQPDLILPVETLIQILEDYLAFRNRRAELNGMEKQRKAIDRRFWEL
jgi:hypothetical protein